MSWSRRLAVTTALALTSFSVCAAVIHVTVPLKETAAYQMGGGSWWTPVPTKNGALPMKLDIDTALEYMSYGPPTYHVPAYNQVTTSSAAGYLLPTFSTPYSADFLEFFGSKPFDTSYSKVDIGRAYSKAETGEEYAWGNITFTRAMTYNQKEGDVSRIVTYLLQLSLHSSDLPRGADAVTAIGPDTIKELLRHVNPEHTFMQEEVQSYLEKDCGSPTGCTRWDATGRRIVWSAVPEPATGLLLLTGAAMLLRARRKKKLTIDKKRMSACGIAVSHC